MESMLHDKDEEIKKLKGTHKMLINKQHTFGNKNEEW
jgi:hypothetical protein